MVIFSYLPFLEDSYVVVRGCIEDFTKGTASPPITPLCQYSTAMSSAYVEDEHVETPYIGFLMCQDEECNKDLNPVLNKAKKEWDPIDKIQCQFKSRK